MLALRHAFVPGAVCGTRGGLCAREPLENIENKAQDMVLATGLGTVLYVLLDFEGFKLIDYH